MKHRQHLALVRVVFATVLLSGCATAAQQQAQQTVSVANAALASLQECVRVVINNPEYSALLPHTTIGDGPTMTQLPDETLPTKQEAHLLAVRHEALVPCRKNFLSSTILIRADVVPIFASFWASSDQVMVQLIERKITWGESARRNQTLSAQSRRELAAADHQWAADLNAQHEAELARRQAAGAALMQWSQQQQLINAATRPVTTNCNRIGQSVNCTSY